MSTYDEAMSELGLSESGSGGQSYDDVMTELGLNVKGAAAQQAREAAPALAGRELRNLAYDIANQTLMSGQLPDLAPGENPVDPYRRNKAFQKQQQEVQKVLPYQQIAESVVPARKGYLDQIKDMLGITGKQADEAVKDLVFNSLGAAAQPSEPTKEAPVVVYPGETTGEQVSGVLTNLGVKALPFILTGKAIPAGAGAASNILHSGATMALAEMATNPEAQTPAMIAKNIGMGAAFGAGTPLGKLVGGEVGALTGSDVAGRAAQYLAGPAAATTVAAGTDIGERYALGIPQNLRETFINAGSMALPELLKVPAKGRRGERTAAAKEIRKAQEMDIADKYMAAKDAAARAQNTLESQPGRATIPEAVEAPVPTETFGNGIADQLRQMQAESPDKLAPGRVANYLRVLQEQPTERTTLNRQERRAAVESGLAGEPAPEPMTMVQEIRAANARTRAEIQALFPEKRWTREELSDLRDLAWKGDPLVEQAIAPAEKIVDASQQAMDEARAHVEKAKQIHLVAGDVTVPLAAPTRNLAVKAAQTSAKKAQASEQAAREGVRAAEELIQRKVGELTPDEPDLAAQEKVQQQQARQAKEQAKPKNAEMRDQPLTAVETPPKASEAPVTPEVPAEAKSEPLPTVQEPVVQAETPAAPEPMMGKPAKPKKGGYRIAADKLAALQAEAMTPEEMAGPDYGPTTFSPLPKTLGSAPSSAPAPASPAPRLGAAAKPIPGVRAAPVIPEGQPIAIWDVKNHVEAVLGRKISSGRVQGDIGGFYDPHSQEVRTKRQERGTFLKTISHEFGHVADKEGSALQGMSPRALSELRALDYDADLARASEGFAEYVRHYIEGNPVESMTPEFTKHFEAWKQSNPEFAKALDSTRNMYQRLTKQNPLENATGNFSRPPTLIRRMAEKLHPGKLWKGFVNSMLVSDPVLKEFQRDMTGIKNPITASESEIRTSRNAVALSKAFRGKAAARAANDAMYGVRDFDGNIVGPSLREDVYKVLANGRDALPEKELFDFYSYVHALHAKDAWELPKPKDPGMSYTDAKALIAQLENRPGFKQAAAAFTEFHNAYLRDIVRAGGAPPELIKMWQDMYPHYISLMREMEAGPSGGGVGGPLNMGKVSKARKGSLRKVLPPGELALQYAERMIKFRDKVLIGNAIAELADMPGAGREWIVKVPAKTKVTSIKVKDVVEQLERMDPTLDTNNLDLDGTLNVFQAINAPEPGKNIYTIYRRGKPVSYEFKNPALAREVNNLDPAYRIPGKLGAIIQGANRLMRLSWTGLNPGFGLGSNFLRDLQTATMQTREMSGNWFNVLGRSGIGMMDDITGGEYSKLWKALGGERSQPLGQDRAALAGFTDYLTRQSKWARAKYKLKHPIDLATAAFSFPEAGPRVAEFKASLERQGWKPGDKMTLEKAVRAMNAASDITLDFTEGGKLAMWINSIVPFFNVGITGPGRFLENMKNRPRQTLIRGIGNTTLKALALWWWNKDKEWYKDLHPYERFGKWHFQLWDKGPVMQLPNSPEYGGFFAALPVALADALYRKDPKLFKESLGNFFDSLSPIRFAHGPMDTIEDIVRAPAITSPIVDVITNKDSLRRPIVPESLRRAPMEERTTPKDTELARKLAGMYTSVARKIAAPEDQAEAGIAPAQVQHIMDAYTGGLAGQATKRVENLLRRADILPKKATAPNELADLEVVGRFFRREGTSRSVSDLYKVAERVSQLADSAAKTGKNKSAISAENRDLQVTVRKLRVIRDKIKAVIESPLQDEAKRARIRQLEADQRIVSRNALEKVERSPILR